jgi:2'-5' RNA ligase
MRTFLSCPIPEEIILYIKSLIPLLPDAKYIVPKQHDLTMKFFGNVPNTTVPELVERLSLIQFTPFEARLSTLGVFSETLIRVVWVGLQPTKAFQELHEQIETALFPIFPSDERFLPHITLARVKALRDRKSFIDQLSSVPVKPMPFLIDHLTLIKSELTSTGAVHTPIFETPKAPLA